MDKLKLIRQNEEQFKKHLQDIQNLEIQQQEQNINKMILESKEENKKQKEAEKYLLELRQKACAENAGLFNKNLDIGNNKNMKLHENLNNFVFNQIYDDSDDDYEKEDNVLQYNINDNDLELKNNIKLNDLNNDERENNFNTKNYNNMINNLNNNMNNFSKDNNLNYNDYNDDNSNILSNNFPNNINNILFS